MSRPIQSSERRKAAPPIRPMRLQKPASSRSTEAQHADEAVALLKSAGVYSQIDAWIWGHEHNLVVYKKHLGVLGRCVGHGAFPMQVDAPQDPPFQDVLIEDVALAKDAVGALFQHGYMVLTIAGPSAKAAYIQYDANDDQEKVLFTEDL